jgi:hypothetical protein
VLLLLLLRLYVVCCTLPLMMMLAGDDWVGEDWEGGGGAAKLRVWRVSELMMDMTEVGPLWFFSEKSCQADFRVWTWRGQSKVLDWFTLSIRMACCRGCRILVSWHWISSTSVRCATKFFFRLFSWRANSTTSDISKEEGVL